MYQLDYPWLLALLPLPILVWWLAPPYREETASIKLPFFSEVAKAVGIAPTPGAVVPRTNWLQKLLAPLCWALVVVALARPQYVEPPLQKIEPQRDLLLALDLSQSMDTRDFKDPSGKLITRLEAVRAVVADFVRRRDGDHIGLIVFGDAPYPQVPFTLDHKTVEAMITDTLPGMAGPRTALGDAIGLAIKLFEKSKVPEKVLVVLTDGNDTASRVPPEHAADIARQKDMAVYTIGVGDPSASGENRVDLGVLQSVAATTGGHFFRAEDGAQLQAIYADIDRLAPAKLDTLSWRPKLPLFQWPLGAAVVLGLALWLGLWLSGERERKGALRHA